MKNKKKTFFSKAIIYLISLIFIFLITVFATKYYFYDSDYAVEETDLTGISIDGIKIGMNINDIDLSKYTKIDDVIDKCNYNFEEISFKTDSKNIITYIVASFKKTDLIINDKNKAEISKVNDIWDELGDNYKTEIYKPEENNYWKISRYVDKENDVYFGIIFSRYNNEILNIILSDERIRS